jgi:hypothetical protein
MSDQEFLRLRVRIDKFPRPALCERLQECRPSKRQDALAMLASIGLATHKTRQWPMDVANVPTNVAAVGPQQLRDETQGQGSGKNTPFNLDVLG